MKIQDGVFKPLLADLKKAAETGGQITGAEVEKVLKKGLKGIRKEFAGADSEKGLAGYRNALAKTFRAADRNWQISKTGYAAAKEILGAKLDGKTGTLAALEKELRSSIKSDSSTPYSVSKARASRSVGT